MKPPILKSRLYLPSRYATEAALREFTYRFTVYEDEETVNPSTGRIETTQVRKTLTVCNYKTQGFGQNRVIGLHRGNLPKLRRLFGKVKWDDRRAESRMGCVPEMVNKPRYNQEHCRDVFLKSDGGGIIRAPTGFGKTYVGILIALALKQKTLVLCSRNNWVEGVWLADIYRHTNVLELEKETGEKLVGDLRNSEQPYPCFSISTFQAFFSKNGYSKCKRLRNEFGLVIADEAIDLPAEVTSKVFTTFNPRWRLGLSACEERKDRKHLLTYDYTGPVIVRGVISKKLKKPYAVAIDAGPKVNVDYLYGQWIGSLQTQISRRKSLNEDLVKRIEDAIEKGRRVMVLLERRDHVLRLTSDLAESVVVVNGKRRPIRVEQLMGRDKNEKVKIQSAADGKYDVFVAIDKCVGKNTNLPGIDCLFDVTPTTNTPVIAQRVGRILRPVKGKRVPIVYFYHYRGHTTKVKRVMDRSGNVSEEMGDDKAINFLRRNKEVRIAWYERNGFRVIDRTGPEEEEPVIRGRIHRKTGRY